MARATFRIWRRRRAASGAFRDYATEVTEGMVVLDAVHQIQAESAPDLAVRWNCKAGKCGSCSAEVNGKPRLMCMTRLSDLPLDEPVTIEPMRAFPLVKDLVTDVSWNFRGQAEDPEVRAARARRRRTAPGASRRTTSTGSQEFRKCIECFLCQDVCHVLREHQLHERFVGPRLLVYAAALEMHPLDVRDRLADLQGRARHRLLQHHQVLHQGLPGEHHDHRQRHHPAQGAGGRRVLRSAEEAAAGVPQVNTERRDQEAGPMFELKPLSPDAIPAALEKAHRYRLLNEPLEAESICRDVLAVDPGHQEALVTLLLALTDQFEERLYPLLRPGPGGARRDRRRVQPHLLPGHRLRAPRQGAPTSAAASAPGSVAYDWYRQAMEQLRAAAEIRPRGNDDAILRWNTVRPHPASPPRAGSRGRGAGSDLAGVGGGGGSALPRRRGASLR